MKGSILESGDLGQYAFLLLNKRTLNEAVDSVTLEVLLLPIPTTPRNHK